MKSIVGLLAASLLATSLIPIDAYGASLLGGLVKTGSDSGNSKEIVSLGGGNDDTSIGLLGSDGISVNLGGITGSMTPPDKVHNDDGGVTLPVVGDLLGGNGGGSLPIVGGLLGGSDGVVLPVDLDDIDVGVPGVAAVASTPAKGGGTKIGVDLLGGGGGSINTNPLGLLGNGGIKITLPDLGDIAVIGDGDGNGGGGGGGNGGGGNGGGGGGGNGGGGGGGNGGGGGGGNGGGGNNGGGGGNGGQGGGGGNGGGGNGGVIVKYYSNDNNSVAIPNSISSRLRALLRILAERDYLRISDGRAVCLNSFGIAEVSGWVPQKDWGKLQQALASYSQDIYVLRQLLANCRSSTQREALNLTQLNRVIAIDIGKDGRPVLFML